VIGWEFSSDEYDISFCCRKAGDSVPKNMEKFNSHKSMIIGYLNAEEPGDYVVRFDNSYSWTKGKSVHYRVFLDAVEVPMPMSK
jgi:hypothetical protein